MSTIVGGTNVLSALGSLTGGSWLRILVLVDAVSVLLGGVMTGTVTTIQLLDRMAQYVLYICDARCDLRRRDFS
jgi:hypothetical protein